MIGHGALLERLDLASRLAVEAERLATEAIAAAEVAGALVDEADMPNAYRAAGRSAGLNDAAKRLIKMAEVLKESV